MTKITIELEHEGELIALQRALMEAKYNNLPNDADLRASTYVTNILNKVTDKIVAIDSAQTYWRENPDKNKIISQLKSGIKESNSWPTYKVEEKIKYAKNLAAPFILTDSFLEECINEAEKI